MPQTSYSIDRSSALAGQVVSKGCVVGKYQASEDIPPGRLVELHTDNTLRLYRGGKLAGVSMYRDAKEPGPWATDDFVPVLREGEIWCDFDGTAASVSELADANVYGPDTTATKRGKMTTASATSAADAQVFAPSGVKFYGPATADAGLVLMAVDLAGSKNASAPSLLAVNAGDFAIPASSKHGQVIELDTTAANSTVSLPAELPDGHVLYIMANGTKNGHTLTFRDVAATISAATTASKRVAAVAMKASGKWAVTLTVGP